MAGFRIFNLKWIVSSPETEGSVYENNDPQSGKIINANGTYGYTDDSWGVKRCLEDFCKPLCKQNDNGEGWQLDDECCPDGEAILLPPNTRVYVMYFKHTSGARLMIGLNYFGMLSFNGQPGNYNGTYDSSHHYYDIGFIGTKTQMKSYQPSSSSSSSDAPFGGGLFMAMIPPAINGQTQEKFKPNISIQDIDFYCQTMTPIQYMKNCFNRISEVTSSTYLAVCTSFIKQGSSDDITSSNPSGSSIKNYGVVLGNTMKLSLLVSDQIIGFTGWYKNIKLGCQICGKILSECRNQEDTLSTSTYGLLSSSCGGGYKSYNYYLNLWHNSLNANAFNLCCNITGSYWTNMYIGYSQNGYTTTSNIYEYIYPGYVVGYNDSYPISVNGQTKAKLRDDMFRFTTTSSNKIYGQTYNNGEWIFFGRTDYYNSFPNENMLEGRVSENLFFRWNGDANGVETFAK